MKRLKYANEFMVGDKVKFKKHPYDDSIYEVIEILSDGDLFIDNGETSHTNIKPSTLELS